MTDKTAVGKNGTADLNLKRRGFSLVELLVVVGIAGVLSGLALMTFIGYSRGVRLTSAAQALNQTLLNARQQAVTSRSSRRVALDLAAQEYWIERKSEETQEWKLPGGRSNALQLGQKNEMPGTIRFADVGGFLPQDISGTRKIWYVEYNNRGSAITYPYVSPPIVRRSISFHETSNLPIHLIEEGAMIPTPEGDRAYDLNDAGLFSYIGSIGGFDLNNDDLDDLNPSVDARMAATARQKVSTVFVLTLTGRSRVFDYGYGVPWSEVDVQEE